MNAEDKNEVIEAMKQSRKLKAYYRKQLANGWSEEQALMNTRDEWWYNREVYELKKK